MKTYLLAAAVLAAAGGAGYGVYKAFFAKPQRGQNMRPVTVERGDIEETVDATGAVAPLNRVEIKPPISGRVEKLLVDEGDAVKAGQIIAWMSSTDRAAILDAARAKGEEEVRRWEDSYKATPVIAPLPGIVILRNVVVGQTVESSTVLFAVSDALIVVAQVDESEIGRVREGMAARVTLDAYPDKPVEGAVFDVLHEGKNVSNVITYGVKVRFSPAPPFFRSQMTANVSFIAGRKKDVAVLPLSAVRELPGGVKQVMVRGEDGKPRPLEIKTGIESGERVEIVDGLSPGDKVLVSGRRYVPQQAAQQSPLSGPGGSGRPRQQDGQAPRQRGSGGGGRRGGG